jgi:hypothetical protein
VGRVNSEAGDKSLICKCIFISVPTSDQQAAIRYPARPLQPGWNDAHGPNHSVGAQSSDSIAKRASARPCVPMKGHENGGLVQNGTMDHSMTAASA